MIEAMANAMAHRQAVEAAAAPTRRSGEQGARPRSIRGTVPQAAGHLLLRHGGFDVEDLDGNVPVFGSAVAPSS
jgi:hypothetical protein